MDLIILLAIGVAVLVARRRNRRFNPPYQNTQPSPPYQPPIRKRGCLTKILWLIVGLVILTELFGDTEDKNTNRIAQVEETTVEEITTEVTTVEETTVITTEATTEEITTEETEVTTEESSEASSDYDLTEINLKIRDSFHEAIEFNNAGHDGYEWTQFIYEIELQDTNAVYITTNAEFDYLSEANKTFILNSAERAVNGVIVIATNAKIDEHRMVRAFNRDGEEIATSGMFNTTEFEFKD